MAINLATNTFQKKTADKFYEESVIGGRTSKEFSFDGSKSIQVNTITTVDPGDYTRSGVSRYGTPTDVQDTKQVMEMTQDKSVSLVVDKGDNRQQMMIKNAGKVLGLEIREKFVPMVDKYALDKWNAGRGAYTVQATLTSDNIVTEIGKHVTLFGNNSVGLDDAICYMGYSAYGLLTEAKQFLNLEKLGVKALADGAVGKVKGLDIKPVPDSYLPTGVNFLTVKKASVLLPFQIKETKIHEDAPGISGALMEVRYLYDAFVIDAKNKGVIACLTAEPSAAAE